MDGESWANPNVDNFVGFKLAKLLNLGVVFTSGLDEVAFIVVTNLLQVEYDLVITLISCKRDAVTICDVTSNTWFANSDRVV